MDQSKKDRDDLYQYKLKDVYVKDARSGASFWYGEEWKRVNKCVFCDLNRRYVITELNGIVLTANVYPYIDGHLMLIPREHRVYLKELTANEWEAVRTLQYIAKKMLKELYGYKSMWVLYREGGLGDESQKTVEHLHIHLLPYQEGLVEWNYNELKTSPFDTACDFRAKRKEMAVYYKRYMKKYVTPSTE
ncbi:MAG: hypothetical protein Fur003_6000 [Candidatus Dojkabacteria bacterium]